jgi:hypothetical protein
MTTPPCANCAPTLSSHELPISIVQGNARSHLLLIIVRVQIVRIYKAQLERLGQQGSNGALAATRDTHDEDSQCGHLR